MTNMHNEVSRLFKEIELFEKRNNLLPLASNTYFMNDGRVLCKPRGDGVSRFPYGTDGFTCWVYSSGYISVNESTYYLVLPSEEGREPFLSFFQGEKLKNGSYEYHSIMREGLNGEGLKRYCVYAKDSCYFLLETKSARYALRIFVNDKKKVCFTTYAYNHKSKEKEIYLASYLNCLFKYCNGESMETKWFKRVDYKNNVFTFDSPEDIDRKNRIYNYGVVKRRIHNEYQNIYNTTSKSEFAGGKESSIMASKNLKKGEFTMLNHTTHFVDTGVAGDLVKYNLKAKEYVVQDYTIETTHSEKELKELIKRDTISSLQEELDTLRKNLEDKYSSSSMLKLNFEGWRNNEVNDKTLNRFLEYVIYQTEYCGLAKNSGAIFLGVRDVMQQIEAALIWNPTTCRSKIIEVLNFISPDGNPPRQYSLPPEGSKVTRMDLRPFIDQGVWIISTIYTYLCYTGDYSILEEEATYYLRDGAMGILAEKKDTVLDHMINVMNYLITHIDENTKCLRAMYGDWNDALDGLGISNKEGVDYGNGVSIMATLQLYRNLNEMIELFTKLNIKEELINQYRQVKEELVNGFKTYGIVSSNDEKKIIHGWGEDRSYLVGSFSDVDSLSRDSLACNAFYHISRMCNENLIENKHIINAYERLDSKYGLKTFNPHFEKDVKGVGRIINLPKGTAENGATYIHATLFGIMSLFMMKEGRKAIDQLEKILPITHKKISTTPFVMPNSYSYNVESNMDGESMSDWYTGSANTLIKTIIRGLFGIEHSLGGISISPSNYFGARSVKMSIKILNSIVEFNYQGDCSAQEILYEGKRYSIKEGLFISKEELMNKEKITISIR